jgi:hypothetical protein
MMGSVDDIQDLQSNSSTLLYSPTVSPIRKDDQFSSISINENDFPDFCTKCQ